MKAYAVIPARYGSTRLPGKLILPEAKAVTGKYLLEHVYSRVKEAKSIQGVIVATDDQRIFEVVRSFGGHVKMTSKGHISGTDRVAEVARGLDSEIIVNVQGDEPDVRPEMIDAVVSTLQGDEEAVMATLANPISSQDELCNPNAVKVVMDNRGYALYFSRSPIPYSPHSQGPLEDQRFYRHLGIYSYRRDFLLRYSSLPPSRLEELERLEQLRALSNGYKIKVAVTPHQCYGVDTNEDFRRFLEKFSKKEAKKG